MIRPHHPLGHGNNILHSGPWSHLDIGLPAATTMIHTRGSAHTELRARLQLSPVGPNLVNRRSLRDLGDNSGAHIVIDQGLSSLSNFALIATIAHFSSSHALGLASVAYAVYLLALGANRAASLELGLLGSGSTADIRNYQFTGSIAVSAAAAIAIGGTSLAMGSSITPYLLVIAIFMVPLGLQDQTRYRAFSEGRPIKAVAVDATWVVLFCGTVLILEASSLHVSALGLLAIWALCGSVSTLVLLHRWTPAPIALRSGWSCARSHASLIRGYLVEYFMVTGVSQTTNVVIAAVAAPALAGSWRVALTYFGPVTVLNSALLIATIRRFTLDQRLFPGLALRRHLKLCAPLVLVTLAWALLGAGPLSPILGRIFGASWPAARQMLLSLGFAYCAGVFVTIGQRFCTGTASRIIGRRGRCPICRLRLDLLSPRRRASR